MVPQNTKKTLLFEYTRHDNLISPKQTNKLPKNLSNFFFLLKGLVTKKKSDTLYMTGTNHAKHRKRKRKGILQTADFPDTDKRFKEHTK